MPNRSSHTTTGNWRARYASEFYDIQGRKWRVEFIDNDIASGHTDFGLSSSDDPHDVNLTDDGFILSWDGPNDHIGGAVIPSTCTVTMVLETAVMENIHAAIRDADDDRFGVAVYMDDGSTDWVPWWVGTLNHEATEFELIDLPNLITLTASCGLNRLRNLQWADDGDQVLGQKTLAELMALCINKIPTANFWAGGDNQFKEVVDVYHEDQVDDGDEWTTTDGDPFPVSVIERTLVNAQAFTEFKQKEEDEFGRRIMYPRNFSSCFEVLEAITNAFGARLFLADHAFWFIPPNAYNWDHTLRVNQWTRTLVAGETIRTTLSGGAYIDTATTADVNFETDIDADHALAMGWVNTYLMPVRRCAITHSHAGQRMVFGAPFGTGIDWPSAGPVTLSNADINIDEGETLNIRGTYTTGQLIKEFGLTTGAAYNSHGFDRIGARIVLRLKIKAGSKFYVSEYAQGDEVDIELPAGLQPDGSQSVGVDTWTGNVLTVGDPVWQDGEGWFDVIVPWTNSNPQAGQLDHSDGETYIAGLHVRPKEGEDVFEYKVNHTQTDAIEHVMDITTAPLPDDSSSYSGVTVTVDRIVVTHTGAVKESFSQLDDIFTAVQAVQYDHNGNDISPSFANAPADRIDDFVVGVGAQSSDGDVTYFVEQSANTEFLDLGETPIQSIQANGGPTTDGSVYILDKGAADNGNFYGALTGNEWHSITDTIDDLDDGADLLTVIAREQLFMRGKPLSVQRGDIVPKPMTGQTDKPFDMSRVLHHNCSTTGDVEDFLLPMTMTYNGGQALTSLDAVRLSRQRLSFEAAQDHDKGGPSRPTTNGPIGPVVQGKGSTFDPVIEGLDSVKSDVSALDTTVGGHTTSIGNNATAIGNNTTSISNAVSTANSAAAQSAVAVGLSAANGTAITAIENKTNHITVSQAVDLDDVERQANKLKTMPASPSVPLLLTVNTSGNVDPIADGTSGQVLTTDGSGRYAFSTVSTTDSVVLASHSGRASTYNGRRFYYGSTLYGWDHASSFSSSQTTFSTISAEYAHAGIIIPKGLSQIELMMTLSCENRTDDVTVHLYRGRRPNGSSTAISLTQVGSRTISPTSIRRHYNADIAVTTSLKKGDLIFVVLYRDGNTATSNHRFTYTLTGS